MGFDSRLKINKLKNNLDALFKNMVKNPDFIWPSSLTRDLGRLYVTPGQGKSVLVKKVPE